MEEKRGCISDGLMGGPCRAKELQLKRGKKSDEKCEWVEKKNVRMRCLLSAHIN